MKTIFLMVLLGFLYPLVSYCDDSSWTNSSGSISCNSDKTCTVSINNGEEFKILTTGYLEGLEESVNQIQNNLVEDNDIVGLRQKILNNPRVIDALILKAKKEIKTKSE